MVDQTDVLHATIAAYTSLVAAKFGAMLTALHGSYTEFKEYCSSTYSSLSPDDRNLVLSHLLGTPDPTPATMPPIWHNQHLPSFHRKTRKLKTAVSAQILS
jgi:hypothetical protein